MFSCIPQEEAEEEEAFVVKAKPKKGSAVKAAPRPIRSPEKKQNEEKVSK